MKMLFSVKASISKSFKQRKGRKKHAEKEREQINLKISRL
jgi:hypothetical protein